MVQTWKLTLTKPAERDLAEIASWTAEQFGSRQAEKYVKLIETIIDKLELDPMTRPSRQRDDLGAKYRTWHVGQKGRHMVLYRLVGNRIIVTRILHDSMDLAQHLPEAE